MVILLFYMSKSINKEILKLAIPSILANITVPLVGMVDIAVAGHLAGSGSESLIGGIAIGTNLFDLLYWNFAFLRVTTGGMTAQAYGRGDTNHCAKMLVRGLVLSAQISVALIAVQWLFLRFAFLFIDCTPYVRELAEIYFGIRIWAAPATLGLMALKGWFIGMQDSVSSMVVDIVVNVVNILGSIFLAMGLAGWNGLGYRGIAAGTVTAQYAGLLIALAIVAVKYGSLFHGFRLNQLPEILKSADRKTFARMNANLVVRSICFIAIYIGYTVISAGYGDMMLASASIMMKLLMLFSYFTDGFAYAGEAMSGKYIGAGDRGRLVQTIKWVFVWSVSIAFMFIAIYYVTGVPMLRLLSSDERVVESCSQFLGWLLLMPLLGVIAFTWDGIFIGATASGYIRNTMIWSVVAFFTVWFIGKHLLGVYGLGSNENHIQLLLAAYFSHLLARSLYQTLNFRKAVALTR